MRMSLNERDNFVSVSVRDRSYAAGGVDVYAVLLDDGRMDQGIVNNLGI